MNKRITALILAIALAAAFFTGCGKKAESSAETNTDQVIISISTEPETLDPCLGWGHGTTPLVQSTLIEYNQDMSFSNDLATEYKPSVDGLTWTFKIRNDVKFTDGEPLTAEDVVFTFETAKNSTSSLDLTVLEKVEAADAETVIFTLTEPRATFLNTIATVGIVPAHAYNENYGTSPIGSGPYKFVQWNKQEQLILEANEDYYGTVPAIKRAVIIFQDEDAAFASVKAGQVDIALTSATLALQQINGYSLAEITTVDNRGFTLPVTPNDGKTTESGYPIGNDVTCNIELRQAMAYAINREMIAEAALNGFATPCFSENDGMPWNNPEVKIEENIDYAKELLSNAGWADADNDGIIEKDGIKAEFNVIYPSGDSLRQALAMAAAEQLKEIGIKITVEGTSWDDISKRMFSEAVCMGWGSSNPYESFCLYHSDYMLRDDYYNPEGYSSETTDAYLEAALASLSTEELYLNMQKAQWDGTTGTSMKGNCPWVWLVNASHLYYIRDGLNIGNQQLHSHGASMPLLQNLETWTWNK